MSKARPVYPGAVVFTTRRVHKRQFLLRPSPRVNQAIEYIVALVAERHGILIHAITVMSNHVHGLCSDPFGKIVEFEHDCYEMIARCLNRMHGEGESLWAREQSSRVTCAEPADVLDKIGYAMANPVAAGLVKCGDKWPGVRGAWPTKPRTVCRPVVFFRDEKDGGQMPAQVTLRFARPPGYEHLSDEELAELVREAIDRHEDKARAKAEREGRRFLGRRHIRKQSRYRYPSSGETRSRIRPRLAAHNKWARIERLQQDRAWLEAYEDAKRRLRAGDPDVIFPGGTWKLRVYYGVACHDPPPSRLAAA